jgi:hypothetical protein
MDIGLLKEKAQKKITDPRIAVDEKSNEITAIPVYRTIEGETTQTDLLYQQHGFERWRFLSVSSRALVN